MTTEESPEQQGEPLANRIARQAAEDANRAKREYGPTGEPEQQVGAMPEEAEAQEDRVHHLLRAEAAEAQAAKLREALVAVALNPMHYLDWLSLVERAIAEGGTE